MTARAAGSNELPTPQQPPHRRPGALVLPPAGLQVPLLCGAEDVRRVAVRRVRGFGKNGKTVAACLAPSRLEMRAARALARAEGGRVGRPAGGTPRPSPVSRRKRVHRYGNRKHPARRAAWVCERTSGRLGGTCRPSRGRTPPACGGRTNLERC